MKLFRLSFWLPTACSCLLLGAVDFSITPSERWTEKEANKWYAKQPWFVGSNYITSNAVNQIEMWQGDTFDPQQIDRELGWAEAIGMNTMRVFLHDLVWQQNPKGFQQRMDAFLKISARHHIRPIFVLFDSCWDPFPKLGAQREPRPGVHNSGWVQSPGAKSLSDPNDRSRLEAYVKATIATFGKDPRILAWDMWNEPDNMNEGSYNRQDLVDKARIVQDLLPKVFLWARSKHPTQPLTSGVWTGDWSSDKTMPVIAKLQIEQSDIVSFHNYGPPEEFEKRVQWLRRYNRPIFCTEYMARPTGSTFQNILPLAQKYKVAAINWGLVAGKTQTYLPWDSWQRPYTDRQPAVWFHDVFKDDGKPYKRDETEFIRQITK
ncbi:MAG TPA: cellulase family glycosylhydrolase [Bryobacteraceae bacterium]|nr:cellulase family glycosylhydrolase [Bryobacteraceae bacterium]